MWAITTPDRTRVETYASVFIIAPRGVGHDAKRPAKRGLAGDMVGGTGCGGVMLDPTVAGQQKARG